MENYITLLIKPYQRQDPYYKVALNKKIAGHTEDFWDVKDKPITDTTNILSIVQNSKMIKDIRNHFADKFQERIEQERDLQAQRLSDNEERRERERLRIVRLGIEANRRRMADEWNPNNTGTEGLAANALREWLIDNGEWAGDTKDDITNQIEDLRTRMDEDPDVIDDPNGDQAQAYGEDLNNLEEELENAESVYDIIPTYDYYGMYEFEYDGAEYAVGDDAAADEAAIERTRSLIDDIGYEGFSESFMEWYVDGDMVADYMEDWFYDDVRESPEDYLDEEDDRQLTDDAEAILFGVDEELGELQEKLEEAENDTEEEEIRDRIEELEIEKEEISEDDDNFEWTEDAMDEYVEKRMQDVRDDPYNYLIDHGMENSISDFINQDEFIDGVIEADGRGHTLSSYDGVENEIMFDDDWYYVYRTN